MLKYRYDPTRVRASFRHKYCQELDLPSGKPSGFEIFPITEEEINNLMGDVDCVPPLDGELTTISEWMLFGALRLKYGVNYMNPMTKQHKHLLFSNDLYQRTAEDSSKAELKRHLEELEIRMQNYIDHEIQYFNEKFLEKINHGEKSTVKTMTCMEEDFKKYFQKNVDIEDF